ncbi:probable serine/threonine-protein kinase dyrk2 isoform X2 [Vespa velutina]|uniref:probable serine/threonine-protein kinase dyrk2 isoform X2 n=1 Tax=Vespa velutina TaxID=202808 RepID=UPI001FB1A4B6|nr:probable serine/threonine-protein kinase dyrk2 isoform X2 [Vespa velutina]
MIPIFYVLLFFGLNHVESMELPSIFQVEDSINRTINEVERLINENPSLPRLSRSDIVEILYNITSKDLEAYGNKDKIEKGRKMYQRALMIVLPYKARESSENLKDLYTKPPIVQMISDSTSGERLEMVFNNDRSKENSGSSESIDNFVEKNRYKNHREIYSEVRPKESLLKETLTPGLAPIRFSFNLENLENNRYTNQETTTIDDDIFFPTTTVTTVDNYQVQDINQVLDKKNDNEKSTTEELTIDLTPSKSKQDILYSDQWRYHAPPPQNIPNEKLENPSVSKTVTKYPKIQQDEKSSTIFVTPLSLNSQTSKLNTTLVLNSGGFRGATSSTSTERTWTEPMRQQVMNLLASIGLRPDNERNIENLFDENKNIYNVQYERSKIPNANGIVYSHTTSPLATSNTDSPSIADQNTFEVGHFDLNKGMENLTPDVRLLFQRFGLQSSNDQRPNATITVTTDRVPTNLYKSFKPLPTSSGVQDEEMREFFARFGLGHKRQFKAMKTEVPSVIEVVPVNMRTILENIGLISNSRRNSKNSINYTLEESKSKYHVFKPHETTFKDENQRSKINELLDTVKLVQQGKADVKDFQKAATDLLKNTKTLSSGPDPLSLEEIIRVYNEDLKNEVKRQEEDTQSSTSVENTTESSTISETDSTEMTEEPTTTSDSVKAPVESDTATETTRTKSEPTSTTTTSTTTNRNLLDLESSFGGSTRAPDPVLPTKRKNGLYFLVDWNTFLEVGEDGSEKIDLRFQPKVGDRSRFLPVTVP